MGKSKKQTQTLWTTPADPSFKLGSTKNKPRERTDGLSQKVRDRELRKRLKPFEALLDSKTLNMHTGHPRTPDLESLVPPEGFDALPRPDDKMIAELLASGETCARSFMGRVDGVDNRGVHATLRDGAGQYSRAILTAALFHTKAYRDLRFLMIIATHQQTKRSGGQRGPNHVCQIKVLPSPEIRLSETEAAVLQRRASKGGQP
ncbi:MAG: hypothetical protein WC766_03140 [Patescibacteria group bacterium]|jgi:hypothetical protein